MALSTTANKVILNGNGVTTAWPFTFPIPDATYLSVIYTDTLGVETVLSNATYSVTGIGSLVGGSVTYPLTGSAIAASTHLTLLRTVPLTQPTVLSNLGAYLPEVVEGALDRLTMEIQQLTERVARAFVAPASDASAPGDMPTSTQRANGGAGSVLGFDSSGNPYAATLTGSLVAVSTWVTNNFLSVTSAAAARIAIGFSAIAAKGDLMAGTAANTIGTLTAGADGSVLMASSGATPGLVWSTQFAGRSLAFNGDFSIDQVHSGASQTFTAAAGAAWTVDGFYAKCTGANIIGQRVTGTAPTPYAYRFTGAASNTGLVFGCPIDSLEMAHLVSQDIVCRVDVKSSTLTTVTWTAYYANSADDFTGKTQIATGSLTGITSTLATKTFTFNAGANAGTGITVELSGGALLGSQTLQFENFKPEAGTVSTAFPRKNIRDRLADCHRHLLRRQATASAELNIAGFGQTTNSVQYWIDRFSVTMRKAPVLTISAAGDFQILAANSTLAATSLALAKADVYGAALSTANGAYTSQIPGTLQSANSSAYLQYDARVTV